jgi:hypothetical protein
MLLIGILVIGILVGLVLGFAVSAVYLNIIIKEDDTNEL